jgi:formate-dependent nitrite reductase membrane component NrfD
MATQQIPRSPEILPPGTPSRDVLSLAHPANVKDKGYYNIPFLKRPLWGWEIAFYFSCEGISAGAYMLATVADLFGGGRYRHMIRMARYLSFAFIVPAPPLLIADLGRPERFHHMLRVFKPMSPMNLGAWALTAYSLPVTMIAAQQAAEDGMPFSSLLPDVIQGLHPRTIAVAGIPGAMTMISYPGVLLSMTSTPVWTRSRLLGALISCSSISMAVAATSLAVGLTRPNDPSLKVLHKIERVAAFCEAGTLAGYLMTTGKTSRPLTTGKYAVRTWVGAVACGLVLPALLTSGKREGKRGFGILGSLLTLAGGLALKWALTHAGRESALDPKANREAMRPSKSAPGWGAPSLNNAPQTSRE